jgi:hypothetical protein
VKRINLGDKVRDRISSYEGVMIARCEYLTGCAQIGIKPQGMKTDGGTHDLLYFDEPFVELVEKNVVQPVEPRDADAGGPAQPMKRG